MNFRFSLGDLEKILGECRKTGTFSGEVTGIASLMDAKVGDISFLANTKYRRDVATCNASIILLPEDYQGEPKPHQIFLYFKEPAHALGKICSVLEKQLLPQRKVGIHPSAVVNPSAKVHESASIGPCCVIEANAQVGAGTVLVSNVHIGYHAKLGENCLLRPHSSVMDYCQLGNRVTLHNGAVIGSDGFGYVFSEGHFEKLAHIGNVIIEDDVEVGANSTIDRGKFSPTLIGEGSKIDNLVQVAHNVVLGKHCLLIAQVGISGSTELGDYVIVAGQAGIAGHLTIGTGSKIAGQSGVTDDIPPQSIVRGTPALPFKVATRIDMYARQLPELARVVKQLEKDCKKSFSKST